MRPKGSVAAHRCAPITVIRPWEIIINDQLSEVVSSERTESFAIRTQVCTTRTRPDDPGTSINHGAGAYTRNGYAYYLYAGIDILLHSVRLINIRQTRPVCVCVCVCGAAACSIVLINFVKPRFAIRLMRPTMRCGKRRAQWRIDGTDLNRLGFSESMCDTQLLKIKYNLCTYRAMFIDILERCIHTNTDCKRVTFLVHKGKSGGCANERYQ